MINQLTDEELMDLMRLDAVPDARGSITINAGVQDLAVRARREILSVRRLRAVVAIFATRYHEGARLPEDRIMVDAIAEIVAASTELGDVVDPFARVVKCNCAAIESAMGRSSDEERKQWNGHEPDCIATNGMNR